MRLRLNLLGGLNLESEGFHRPKPLLLLAYLALEGRKEKRHVQELFWSDAANPAGSLRTAMNQLRQVSSDLILSDEHMVWTTVENDLTVLQSAISERDAPKIEALYHGEFLRGFSLPDWSAELEEWVLSTREFLAARVRGTFIRAAESKASKGAFDLAAQWAAKAFAVKRQDQTPEDLEHVYPLLIAGDSALADEVRKQAKEFGLELKLSHDEARGRYVTATLAGKTEAQTIPNNLPRAKTSFIGCDPELVELGQMIGQPEVQLLTLLGPGGIGKTRLSLQLAAGQLEEANFPDAVYFVALESLNEPAQIPLLLAQTLQIKLTDDPFVALKSAIDNKHMLLVMDNFEPPRRKPEPQPHTWFAPRDWVFIQQPGLPGVFARRPASRQSAPRGSTVDRARPARPVPDLRRARQPECRDARPGRFGFGTVAGRASPQIQLANPEHHEPSQRTREPGQPRRAARAGRTRQPTVGRCRTPPDREHGYFTHRPAFA
jgi:hypothetical protein